MYVYVVHGSACTTTCMRRSEGSLWELVLSFPMWVLRIALIRFNDKCLYSLSHLTGPSSVLTEIGSYVTHSGLELTM